MGDRSQKADASQWTEASSFHPSPVLPRLFSQMFNAYRPPSAVNRVSSAGHRLPPTLLRLSSVVLLFLALAVAVGLRPTSAATPRTYIIADEEVIDGDGAHDIDGDGQVDAVGPGDVLLVPHDRKNTRLSFKDVRGSESAPVVIKNMGGAVRLTGGWAAIQIRNSEHVHLTGTGEPGIDYGFEMFNLTGGIRIYERSRYIEIDHVHIHDTSGAGISAKTDEPLRDQWIQYDTRIHHSFLHDIGTEGLYIGSSFWQLNEHPELRGVEIAYNRIERTGWDGIQVGSAVADVWVHHNVVIDSGLSGQDHSGNGGFGIIVNRGTTGDYYNNIILNTRSAGVYIQGIGGYRFFNNLIVNAGSLPNPGSGRGIGWDIGDNGTFYNNTIVGCLKSGINVGSGPSGGAIYDNLIVAAGSPAINPGNIAATNNLVIDSASEAGFVDPSAGDYHLSAASPAVDTGSASGFALEDLDGVPRPQGSSADIGAYEYLPVGTGIDRFAEDPLLGLRSSFEELTPGRWAVVEDGGDLRYALISTTHDMLPGSRLGEWSLVRDQTYSDFTLRVTARTGEAIPANEGADFALIFGWQDPENYLYVLPNSNPEWSAVSQVFDGVSTDLIVANEALIADNTYHEFTLIRKGETVNLFIDGVERLRSDGIPSQPGAVGLGSKNDAAFFDDFQLRPETPTFADVPFTHPYHDEIEALYQAGFTVGCGVDPLIYCPDQAFTRGESSVFVERGIHGVDVDPPQPGSQTFGDVALETWFARWVDALWNDGYTAGCGTDPLVFCPFQGHTRAEGAVFYLRMLNGTDYVPPDPQGIFADVPAGWWGEKWVEAAYSAGILPACGTGPLRACPDDPLTRGLAASMMVRAKGLGG